MASKWMETADVNGNGTIDQTEFEELINKLDEKLTDEKWIPIFKESDNEGNGELKVENFGAALYSCFKLMNNNEED